MKSVIRRYVFETNSSSVHSCVIMTEDQHKKWLCDNLYYYRIEYIDYFRKIDKNLRPQEHQLYTQDEVMKYLELLDYHYDEEDYYDKDQYIRECDCGFLSYNMWQHSDYLDYDINYFTTPSGEKIVVDCKYGRDD